MALGKKYFDHSHGRNPGHSRLQSAARIKRKTLNQLGRLTFLAISLLILSSCKVTKSVRNKSKVVAAEKAAEQKVIQPQQLEAKAVTEKIKRPLSTQQKVAQYLKIFGPIAQREMKEYKIPASITLAQGLLESGFGEGRLALEGNNHFGIKCHRDWKGGRIYHDDDEKGECFRVYADAGEYYKDHSLFLSERDRYAFLFRLGKRDYKAWAKGLKKAGYATDPKYPDKLIRLIEQFDLAAYDKKATQEIITQKVKKSQSNERVYVVQQGDTLYAIAIKLQVEVSVLKRKNNLKDSTIYLGQELILPKK
jgi:flagellum-specific peptidoglycan hydrolase FlgJ